MSDRIDVTIPSDARMWSYFLGGKDHFAADRLMGEQIKRMFPPIVDVARADRAFLVRVVRVLSAELGLEQFLDVGTGLPTSNNTHEVAQQVNPAARVVYVDNDPIVLAHARVLLSGTEQGRTDYVDADAREPEVILERAARTLDFSRPVGLMLLGLLNFLNDEEAARTVRVLVDALPAGSHLAITHPTLELGGEGNVAAMRHFNDHAPQKITARTREQVTGYFSGLELLEPGLVSCSQWRPDEVNLGVPQEVPQFGGVARKN